MELKGAAAAQEVHAVPQPPSLSITPGSRLSRPAHSQLAVPRYCASMSAGVLACCQPCTARVWALVHPNAGCLKLPAVVDASHSRGRQAVIHAAVVCPRLTRASCQSCEQEELADKGDCRLRMNALQPRAPRLLHCCSSWQQHALLSSVCRGRPPGCVRC